MNGTRFKFDGQSGKGWIQYANTTDSDRHTTDSNRQTNQETHIRRMNLIPHIQEIHTHTHTRTKNNGG